jgi:hypothetical protein
MSVDARSPAAAALRADAARVVSHQLGRERVLLGLDDEARAEVERLVGRIADGVVAVLLEESGRSPHLAAALESGLDPSSSRPA